MPSAYAAARFELEYWRGDSRARIGSLSYNQWMCLAILAVVAALLRAPCALAALAAIAIRFGARRHRSLSVLPLSTPAAFARVERAVRILTPDASIHVDDIELRRDGDRIAIDASRGSLGQTATRVLEELLTAAARGHRDSVKLGADIRSGGIPGENIVNGVL